MDTPPPDEIAVRVWVRLARAQQVVAASVEGDLKAAGLPSLAWYAVLLELDRAAGGLEDAPPPVEDATGLRPFELQQRLLLAQYNASRLIDRLEKAGLIQRRACPEDGRGQVVAITAEGRAMRRRMWPVYRDAVQRRLGDVLGERYSLALEQLLDMVINDRPAPAEAGDQQPATPPAG